MGGERLTACATRPPAVDVSGVIAIMSILLGPGRLIFHVGPGRLMNERGDVWNCGESLPNGQDPRTWHGVTLFLGIQNTVVTVSLMNDLVNNNNNGFHSVDTLNLHATDSQSNIVAIIYHPNYIQLSMNGEDLSC